MPTLLKFVASSGTGSSVVNTIVCGSSISTPEIPAMKLVKDEGEFSTVGTRQIV